MTVMVLKFSISNIPVLFFYSLWTLPISADLVHMLHNCMCQCRGSAHLSYPITSGWIRGQREMDDVRKRARLQNSKKRSRKRKREVDSGVARARRRDKRMAGVRRKGGHGKVSKMMCESNAERWRK